MLLSVPTVPASGLEVPPSVPAADDHPLWPETPPMGWNSWDSYGTTIKESEFKANAQWLAEHLKAAGWQYVVVDMEWFVANPVPEGNSRIRSSVWTTTDGTPQR